jgi:hypothetical protein
MDTTAREAFLRKLGKRPAKSKVERKVVHYKLSEYPWRSNSLGKSSGSMQGVAGWRSSYYQPQQEDKKS